MICLCFLHATPLGLQCRRKASKKRRWTTGNLRVLKPPGCFQGVESSVWRWDSGSFEINIFVDCFFWKVWTTRYTKKWRILHPLENSDFVTKLLRISNFGGPRHQPQVWKSCQIVEDPNTSYSVLKATFFLSKPEFELEDSWPQHWWWSVLNSPSPWRNPSNNHERQQDSTYDWCFSKNHAKSSLSKLFPRKSTSFCPSASGFIFNMPPCIPNLIWSVSDIFGWQLKLWSVLRFSEFSNILFSSQMILRFFSILI